MKSLNVLIVFFFFNYSCRYVQSKGDSALKKPNIIFIIADDLGYNNVGFNGQDKIKTPNIDLIASEGMIFKNHYSGSPVCGPSRSCLLSGNHTGRTNIRENPGWTTNVGSDPLSFSTNDQQLGVSLQNAGYSTACIGKWGMVDWGEDMEANNQGFDYFFGYKRHGEAHHYYPEFLWRNGEKVLLKGNVPSEKKGMYTHDLIVDDALKYVTEKSSEPKPFFLYLSFTIPHFELTVPQDSKAQYLNLGWDIFPMKAGHYYHDDEGNAAFAGMISRMDRDIGRLMTLLKETGQDENTLIIFTSDNGAEYTSPFFENNKPFRGKKRDVYDGGIHMPMAARWPKVVKPGVSYHISAFWDFLPTACEVAGVKPPLNIDGISYYNELLGNPKQQKKHDYLYWEFNEGTPKQAIRYQNWKLVKLWEQPYELFDLSKDIAETNNVASDNPKILTKLQAMMAGARTNDPNYDLVPLKQKKIER
jgi:arylsulfatase A-like enzyme